MLAGKAHGRCDRQLEGDLNIFRYLMIMYKTTSWELYVWCYKCICTMRNKITVWQCAVLYI